MTKSQIKAELRRSAMEDYLPWYDCNLEAFCLVAKFGTTDAMFSHDLVTRTLFLLVAEAIDD